MTNTITNIKKVALIFFILAGISHLGSSMFIANDIFPDIAKIINKTSDAPLILTGLLYGFSSLRLSLTNTDKNHKLLDITLGAIIIIVLIAVIVINLAIPNIQ